ncbi:hypothetical protein ACFQL0_10375 [Haloplanus litoreus]|uniref:hypothetical protein n=1 Tax=Haloplanus litoreus TaxID=767515 RepID=UPI0036072C6C
MSSLRSGSITVAVVGTPETAAAFRSGVGPADPRRRRVPPAGGRRRDAGRGLPDCLLVDDGVPDVDGAAVAADVGDAVPVVVLVDGGYDRTTAALSAGAADTLPDGWSRTTRTSSRRDSPRWWIANTNARPQRGARSTRRWWSRVRTASSSSRTASSRS